MSRFVSVTVIGDPDNPHNSRLLEEIVVMAPPHLLIDAFWIHKAFLDFIGNWNRVQPAGTECSARRFWISLEIGTEFSQPEQSVQPVVSGFHW
jgi:hypothetical protein